ncbi:MULTISPECIES: hypothetical protein [Mycolicibacterium]|jgi:hypothetical protein|uniref:Uncharacterized protein n=2 Tax=Mycolicibacterium TaxID=1866885 RepID=A0A7I7ZZ71_9MYCO|nr:MULTISPECIES: hypothetical protein [Mycolicibacterium]TDK84706.1 hypothetical protein EUA03_25100 [Mycolicibacterium mucogenicum]TLH64565.1 hypothetical protein C1S79_18125 [Mycolicibacterium phocaicum]TXH16403.1 MAG: hypothetical protein E6R06_31115 [Mycobacterium sp.]BBZ58643.1 hypothetical protein MPHO_56350 [Mycolicibacterium phocaicum]
MTTQTPLRIVLVTCAILGLITLALGIWAFVAPMSFFEVLAPFEPYNRHFLHDAGVLQIGVGVAMLLAAARRSPVEVALGGFIAFEALHVVSHVIDRDLGGRPAFDITALSILTIAGVAALIAGRRQRSNTSEPERPIQPTRSASG